MRPDADVTVIVAPAGFGKTRTATRLVDERDGVGGWCDCSASSLERFAGRIVDALAHESAENALATAEQRVLANGFDARDWALTALASWTRRSAVPATFVFDNFEAIAENEAAIDLVGDLLAQRPAHRHVVLCSRIALPRRISRLLQPDRTAFVSAAHLRISDADTRAILRAAGAAPQDVERGVAVAAGWPMAVLLLSRLAREGRIADDLGSGHTNAYDSLFAYLVSEYVRLLSPEAFDALLFAVMLPGAEARETAELAKMSAREFAEMLDGSPFLERDAAGAIRAHPLIVALFCARYGHHRDDVLRRALARAQDSGDWLRAAEIAFHWGDQLSAARFLAALDTNISPGTLPRLLALLGRLDRDAILEEPNLWVATLELRRCGMPLAAAVAEAKRVATTVLRGLSDRALLFDVVRQNVTVLMHAGKLDDARTLIAQARALLEDDAVRRNLDLMEAAIASIEGRYGFARSVYQREAGAFSHLNARYLDLIDATTALRSGNYDEGVAMLEEATRIARRRCWVAPLLVSLSNLAYEAWLVRDEERFARTVAELKSNVLPGLERAWRFWLAAANGVEEEPTGYEPVSIVAIGHLFIACASLGATRIRNARKAVLAAEASGDLGLRVVAYLTLAEYDAERRREAHRELRALGATTDLVPLRDAVAAYVDGAARFGALEAFVSKRLRHDTPAGIDIHLQVTRAMIVVDGCPVVATALDLALLHFLGTYQRAASRQAICDALWPDADGDAGANSLRVSVHRIRKKLGASAIVQVASGYCLGPHVRIDLFAFERFVRDAQARGIVGRDDANELARIGEAVGDRRRDELLAYPWYAGIDRRLAALRRTALMVAARSALALGDAVHSRELAAMLVADDPADDEARELCDTTRAPANPVLHAV